MVRLDPSKLTPPITLPEGYSVEEDDDDILFLKNGEEVVESYHANTVDFGEVQQDAWEHLVKSTSVSCPK